MDEILLKYALPTVIMAIVVMVLVGFVKIFTKMLPHAESKLKKVASYFYVILTAICSVGVTFAYCAIFKLGFDLMYIVKTAVSVYGCSQVLYPIYRDYGGRYIFNKIIGLFKGKSKQTDLIISAIEKVVLLTEDQKQKITNNLNNK